MKTPALTLIIMLAASSALAQTMTVQSGGYATAPAYGSPAPAPQYAAPAPSQPTTGYLRLPPNYNPNAYNPNAGQPNTAYPADPYAGQGDYVPPAADLVQRSGNIAYATGGVGEEEEAQMKAIANQFNLHVLSTQTDGAFVGDYSLRISNSRGVVLEAPGNGPLFYAALPAGSYDVQAYAGTQLVQSAKVTLGASGHREVRFRW